MAYFSISNIQINGIAAAVPKNSVSNFSLEDFEKDELTYDIDDFGFSIFDIELMLLLPLSMDCDI